MDLTFRTFRRLWSYVFNLKDVDGFLGVGRGKLLKNGETVWIDSD
jgi:hypothetical protein